MGNSLKLLATIHYRRGRQDEAEREAAGSLEMFLKADNLEGASESHYLLGNIREKEGDHEGALREFEKSIESAQSARDDILRARAGLGVGRILAKRGEYEKSLRKFMESIETFEKLNEVEELPRAYTSAGASAFYVDVDKSLEWHEKCIELSRMIGDVVMLGYGLSNAAGCDIKRGEAKKVIKCHRDERRVEMDFDPTDYFPKMKTHIISQLKKAKARISPLRAPQSSVVNFLKGLPSSEQVGELVKYFSSPLPKHVAKELRKMWKETRRSQTTQAVTVLERFMKENPVREESAPKELEVELEESDLRLIAFVGVV
ncbi:MAG: tol-pal system YbgF family protein [Thermoplasmata archaeon]